MPRYYWDSIHNSLAVDDEDFEDGVLKPGHALRVRMTAMDSTQVAIAQSQNDEVEDDETEDGDEFTDQRAMLDFEKARIAAAWRGGLTDGDQVQIKGKMFTVNGRNPETGAVQLTDSGELSADELKTAAYLEADWNLQNAWRTSTRDAALPSTTAKVGGDCQIDGNKGRWAIQNGQLVCSPVQQSKYRAPASSSSAPDKQPQRQPSATEWEMGGPLSDQGGSAQEIKDACYEEYARNLENAWRWNK